MFKRRLNEIFKMPSKHACYLGLFSKTLQYFLFQRLSTLHDIQRTL